MFENYEVIDLTLTLSENLPCSWPAHMPFKRTNWNWYSSVNTKEGVELSSKLGPYFTEWLVMDEHAGTHFDAPSHYIPHPDSGFDYAGPAGLITGEKVALSKMMGNAIVINVTHLTGKGNAGESPLVTAADLIHWEEENGFIDERVVLFYSGWDQYYQINGNKYSANAFHQNGPGWVSPDAEAIDLLYNRGVYCVGTDGVSIGAAHEGLSAHVAGLSKEMVYVESLTNLDKLPTRGSSFLFLPIKVEKSSGGPGRAISFISKK